MRLEKKDTWISNPLLNMYQEKTDVILFTHSLMGTIRGKSANGIMMHSKLFNTVAIIDKNAVGKDTSKICPGVNIRIPIYPDISKVLKKHSAKAIIFLIPPNNQWYSEIEIATNNGLDIINTSFDLIKNDKTIMGYVKKNNINFVDLRDVPKDIEYPNVNIVNRKAKVIYVAGTDCALGKRTAAYELSMEAKKQGFKSTMYATGQTGLMLGEIGIVTDAMLVESYQGVLSQHICRLDELGYELIFIEGQADIFHPQGSLSALALAHGSNPDCIILVHDESRKTHKGFEEDASLYKMHPFQKHIDVYEMLSLPCGPIYKTVGIATIGTENIKNIKKQLKEEIPVADVRQPGGPAILLKSIIEYCNLR